MMEKDNAAELEPMGMDAGAFHLIAPPPPQHPPLVEARTYPGFADMVLGSQCRVDGIDTPCGMVSSNANIQCPNNDCGPRAARNSRGDVGIAVFGIDPATGRTGYWAHGTTSATVRFVGYPDTPGGAHIPWMDFVPVNTNTDSFLEHASNLGISQTKIVAQQPSPQGFPCPPSIVEIFTGRGGRAVTSVLNSTWDLAHQTNREEGGWIYMNKRGGLKAVMKDRGPEDTQTTINLDSPQIRKGWIMIGTFHTHDFGSTPSPSIPTGERDGIKFQIRGDEDINKSQKVPGIILGGVHAGIQAFAPYGPDRGFFTRDLPERCKR